MFLFSLPVCWPLSEAATLNANHVNILNQFIFEANLFDNEIKKIYSFIKKILKVCTSQCCTLATLCQHVYVTPSSLSIFPVMNCQRTCVCLVYNKQKPSNASPLSNYNTLSYNTHHKCYIKTGSKNNQIKCVKF
jgi:hypothetical protein